MDGRSLLLDWWSLVALCARGNQVPLSQSFWVQVLGLLVHLRREQVFRAIGDCCGTFLEVDDETMAMEALSVVFWSEEGPVVVAWGSPETKVRQGPRMENHDFRRFDDWDSSRDLRQKDPWILGTRTRLS
ncbi:hypothetical protein CsSME_00007245 [Camellia sinensis var. sinensis]